MLRRGVITCKGDRCRPGTVADAVENIRDGRCGVGFGSSVSVDSLVHKAIDFVQCLSFSKVTQFSKKLAFSVPENSFIHSTPVHFLFFFSFVIQFNFFVSAQDSENEGAAGGRAVFGAIAGPPLLICAYVPPSTQPKTCCT
jgi:hypothetical protein